MACLFGAQPAPNSCNFKATVHHVFWASRGFV
jgi:hypothetical protein